MSHCTPEASGARDNLSGGLSKQTERQAEPPTQSDLRKEGDVLCRRPTSLKEVSQAVSNVAPTFDPKGATDPLAELKWKDGHPPFVTNATRVKHNAAIEAAYRLGKDEMRAWKQDKSDQITEIVKRAAEQIFALPYPVLKAAIIPFIRRACEEADAIGHTRGWDAAIKSCGEQIAELRRQIATLTAKDKRIIQ